MTKKQRREHKLANQVNKARLLRLYYKVKPASKGWMPLGAVCQNGKHTLETGVPLYDNLPALTTP